MLPTHLRPLIISLGLEFALDHIDIIYGQSPNLGLEMFKRRYTEHGCEEVLAFP
jgi:hypothetical protein